MYQTEVHNREAVVSCLKQLERRKGKRAVLGDVPDGALIRSADGGGLYLLKRDEVAGIAYVSTFPAWSHLLGHLCMGTGGPAEENAGMPVLLVATPEEIVQPDLEPVLKTVATITADGLAHCQNYIYGLPGQHFIVKEPPTDRPTETQQGVCNCGLELGECREYDGHVWRREVATGKRK